MPGTTGLELIEEIRRRGLVVPAVLTKARTDPALLLRAAKAGVVTVDPLTPAPLIEAVTAALLNSAPVSPPAAEPPGAPGDE